MTHVGVARNPYEHNVPAALLDAAKRLGVRARAIDIATLRTALDGSGEARVRDRDGEVVVDCLTPYLLYGVPSAVLAYSVLTARARTQNSLEATLAADDKAVTALRLASAGVAQVPTELVPLDPTAAREAAQRSGYPVVLKRTHGAQGRWVRRASTPDEVDDAVAELAAEGPGALVVQPEVVEARGSSLRVVVTGGRVVAVTERRARDGEWRSNINQGGRQYAVPLTGEEAELADRCLAGMAMTHAGIDIIRTASGPRILEVNACPDFTSMQPYADEDLAVAVLRASLP